MAVEACKIVLQRGLQKENPENRAFQVMLSELGYVRESGKREREETDAESDSNDDGDDDVDEDESEDIDDDNSELALAYPDDPDKSLQIHNSITVPKFEDIDVPHCPPRGGY